MPKTDNKAKGLELLKAGGAVEDIASELGVKVDTVKGWRRDSEKQARKVSTPPARQKDQDLFSGATDNEAPASNALDAPVSDVASLELSSRAETEEAEFPASGPENEGAGATKKATFPDASNSHLEPAQVPVEASSQTWLLATNHQNMAYMLSTGMLMGPSGFGGKHYHDPATVFPGWLPLFRNDVPEVALKECVSERKDLRLCIAEVNVKQMGGLVRQVRRNGEIRDMSLPGEIDDEVIGLLIPAPLPTTLLTRLHFHSHGDQKEFQAVCSNGAKIDLSHTVFCVAEQSFSGSLQATWPPSGSEEVAASATGDTPPARGQAVGGVIAMLFQLANRSHLCCAAYRVIAGASTDADIEAIKHDAVLRELPYWLASSEISANAPINARLYWGVAEALISAHLHNSTAKPVDTVLEYLERQSAAEENLDPSRLDRLIKTMKDALGMARGTISDLLKQHPGSLSRPLLLLCLRERCKDLLEFSYPDLKDEELVLAAILFAVREGGWRRLPLELRRPDTLASYVMHRMCTLEQGGRLKGRLTLGSEPPRPKSLRELVTESGAWNTSRDNGAFGGFAARHGWSDCIVTRVRFPEGAYRLSHSAEGLTTIEFHGIVEDVSLEVHKENLMKRVAQLPAPPAELEHELTNILGRERD